MGDVAGAADVRPFRPEASGFRNRRAVIGVGVEGRAGLEWACHVGHVLGLGDGPRVFTGPSQHVPGLRSEFLWAKAEIDSPTWKTFFGPEW